MGKGKVKTLKNPAPMIFAGILVLFLISMALIFYAPAPPPQPAEKLPPPACMDGQTRSCTTGGCSGIATCKDGKWWGCRWNQTCRPGARAPCLNDNGCSYAVKECNDCGTGYGPCMGPDTPG